MPRDYAKPRKPASRSGGAQRNGGRSSGGGGMSGSTGLAVGLALGLAIAVAVGAYFSIEKPSNRVKLGQDAAAPAAPVSASLARKGGGESSSSGSGSGSAKTDAPATKAADDPSKPIKLPPKQPSRFAFYEMLPSYEVVIPRESTRNAKPGQPANPPSAPDVKQALAEPGQYLIQVGAYRSRDEADRHRASLALLGIESRIEQVTIDQKDTWYRVRIGPEPNLAKAQEILDRLDDHDIKGLLIKVKG